MMTKIKYGLSFFLGAIYASAWSSLFIFKETSVIFKLSLAILAIGTICLVIGILIFFAEHWGD